jgi:hypothetical protein
VRIERMIVDDEICVIKDGRTDSSALPRPVASSGRSCRRP